MGQWLEWELLRSREGQQVTDNAMKAAVTKMRPEEKPKEDKPANAYSTPKRQGKRGYTIYLDPIPHSDLKHIAVDEGVTLEALTIEGLNYVLQKRGRSPIA